MALHNLASVVVHGSTQHPSHRIRLTTNSAAAGCFAAAAANRLAAQKLWSGSIVVIRRGTPTARPFRGLNTRRGDEERPAQGSGQDAGDRQCVKAHGRASVIGQKVLRQQTLVCIGRPPVRAAHPARDADGRYLFS